MKLTEKEITLVLDDEIEFAKGTGMPQFVMGLQQAKKVIQAKYTVKKEMEK